MSWVGKRVKRNSDNAEGEVIKFDNGHLDPAAVVTVKLDNGDVVTFHIWAWAVPPPNGWAIWFNEGQKWVDLDNVGK